MMLESGAEGRAEQLRHELQEYLEVVKTKKDDEGSPVCHFPKNFDAVVQMMSHSEISEPDMQQAPRHGVMLSSSSPKKSNSRVPWAQYLLESELNFNGPYAKYDGIITEEEKESEAEKKKIALGMAKIRKLDMLLAKQYHEAETAARERRLRESSSEGQMAGGTPMQTARSWMSTAPSPPFSTTKGAFVTQRYGGSGAPSIASSRNDGILLLKDSQLGGSEHLSSDADFFNSSPRTNLDPVGDETFLVAEENVSTSSKSGRSTKGRLKGKSVRTLGNDSFISRNISAAGCSRKRAPRLSQEEEERAKMLLEDDDGSDGGVPQGIWAEIVRYGPTQEEESRLAEVAARLEEQRTLGLSLFPSELGEEVGAELSAILPGEEVLRQERLTRMQRAKERKIDDALHAIRSLNINSPLNSNDTSSVASNLQPSMKVFKVDPLAFVQRPVQAWEVSKAIREARECNQPLADEEELEALLHVVREDLKQTTIPRRDPELQEERRSAPETGRCESAGCNQRPSSSSSVSSVRKSSNSERQVLPPELSALFNQ